MSFLQKFSFKSIMPYLLIVVGFIVISYAYTPDVLEGKIVNQSDISSWRGMANEIIEHNKTNPEDKALWTNSMFSGMPAVTVSVIYDGDYTKPFYNFLHKGARPASYLLISLLGGFLLFLAFGANIYLAAIGAIAITFCSYNMQIIQVGHNSKMVAIAFMPWVLAGVVYAYRRNALWGAILFAFALSFQIKANHPQITYYLAMIIVGYAIAELYGAIKERVFVKFLKTSTILLVTGLLGIATNANHLIPTYEYAEYTMRGGSELSNESDVQTGDGLKIDYATRWSYGINETPNLLIPNFNGGSSNGELDKSSETYKVLKGKYQGAEQIIKGLPLYWGPQPFTAGPMYLGALSIFLFVLGLALIKGRYKWWIVGVSLLALFLGWGSHFMWFSKLFFNYIPLYNKFRAVSMILSILQITVPILGILITNKLLFNSDSFDLKKVKQGFLIALGATAGFSFIFMLIPALAGNFVSAADGSLPAEMSKALVEDRKSLLRMDAFRSIIFIVLGAGALWLGYTKKIKSTICMAAIGVLIFIDLWGVDKRYLNSSHFIRNREFHNQFAKRPVDNMILADEDPNYRVLDLSVNTFNDSHTSYHHKTIGGYSPAKLQRYQDLIDYYIAPEMSRLSSDINSVIETAKSVQDLERGLKTYPILGMLNTKYIIIDAQNPPIEYNQTLGNAWFVSNASFAKTADEEIELLGEIDPATTAIISEAIISDENRSKLEQILVSAGNVSDSLTQQSITLTEYKPNSLKYSYTSSEDALALFSEIYYPAGWTATIDGKPTDILRANYILRALMLPAGEHEIEFKFEPKSFSIGENISKITSIILLLTLLAIAGFEVYRRRRGYASPLSSF